MTAAVTESGRRIHDVRTLPRLATPDGAAASVDIVRVVLAIVLVALALAGLAVTGGFVAGPIPEVGPQPGF
jgi:hypothetical protein